MLALNGIYKNGKVTLDKKVSTKDPVKVIVTFVDENIEVLHSQPSRPSYSFLAAQELLSGVKGSLSDSVIEDRRKEL